ncbi:carbohydrate esterase family 12 protein [Amniculicola lignicola CBS 123094]|uniref:Carbohydrate esterase family 12 protein n=1 Tax=Amniculicola lignicola CBS 123094 TaxID=1392246 RepID=A0A6A5WRB6_9PLEO|nr:carbohydrate esterase family 12 protein [Amniculicola lignicola CBS 123094]
MYSLLVPFLALSVSALPSRNQDKRPIYWLLAGDSTTAPNGGWGDAFLNTTVASPSSGHNYGHSGATTASFRAGGDWNKTITEISTWGNLYEKFYVTIQFGHNDQKPTSGVTLDQYKANLATFTNEVRNAGGIPILLSPLTRRNFNSTTGMIIENLTNERIATKVVAQITKTPFIDLNQASLDYVNKIGKDAASKYNLAPSDWTHLNPWGGVVFARIVSDLLVEWHSDFKKFTVANATLSAQIKAGVPA